MAWIACELIYKMFPLHGNNGFYELFSGFWSEGQPNTKSGKCVQSSTGESVGAGLQSWELTTCETLLPFVCRAPACPEGT